MAAALAPAPPQTAGTFSTIRRSDRTNKTTRQLTPDQAQRMLDDMTPEEVARVTAFIDHEGNANSAAAACGCHRATIMATWKRHQALMSFVVADIFRMRTSH